MLIPGTDGQKMSKSRNNFIDIFASEKELKKQVMSISSDSTPLEAPKDPSKCSIYSLYSLIASKEEVSIMHRNYLAGGFGYGHAKQALFDAIITRFHQEREKYIYFMSHEKELNLILAQGAEKARKTAQVVLSRVRNKLGY